MRSERQCPTMLAEGCVKLQLVHCHGSGSSPRWVATLLTIRAIASRTSRRFVPVSLVILQVLERDFFRPVDGIPSTVYTDRVVKPEEPNMPVPRSIALARTTVTTAATEHLREQIVCGRMRPGETLPESQVGEMLGVSRAPIREALTLLEREGLVEFDRRGTARVCDFDLEDVRELGLMRMVLEPVATRLAAERRPEATLDAIEENLHALQPPEVSRLEDVTRLDLDFHRLIFAAAGNRRLRLAWENLLAQFFAGNAAVSRVFGTTGADVQRSRHDDPGALGVVPGPYARDCPRKPKLWFDSIPLTGCRNSVSPERLLRNRRNDLHAFGGTASAVSRLERIPMLRRLFFFWLLTAVCWSSPTGAEDHWPRFRGPNIVWIFVEDMNGWDGLLRGQDGPHPEHRLARRPRRALRSGVHARGGSVRRRARRSRWAPCRPSLGVHNHRSSRKRVPEEVINLPEGVKTVYELMRGAGYHVTSSRGKNDFNFVFELNDLYDKLAGRMGFSKDHWAAPAAGQAVLRAGPAQGRQELGASTPARRRVRGSRKARLSRRSPTPRR